MRKTRKYPFMFGSVRRRNRITRNTRQIIKGPSIKLDCAKCVSEPICFDSLIP